MFNNGYFQSLLRLFNYLISENFCSIGLSEEGAYGIRIQIGIFLKYVNEEPNL